MVYSIVISEYWTGLSNQVIALVNGLIETIYIEDQESEVGKFIPEINSKERIKASQIFDFGKIYENTGIKLFDTENEIDYKCYFEWYTYYDEKLLCFLLRQIRFKQNFYDVADDLYKKHFGSNQEMNVIHLRMEQDAITHWSKMNELTKGEFEVKLKEKYSKAIYQNISKGSNIFVLTFDTKHEFLKELSKDYKIITIDTYNLCSNKLGFTGREICAIIDLLIGIKCNGVFIGCHNFKKKRGSSFSYMLWRLMEKAKKGVFIDLDQIDNRLEIKKNHLEMTTV